MCAVLRADGLLGMATENPPPARVVLLLEDLRFGGSQRQAIELAKNLNPALFRVQIWLMTSGADMVPGAGLGEVPVICLSPGSRPGPESLLNLWRRLRSQDIDILVLLTVVPNIWGRLLGRLAGGPVIIGTCRGGGAAFRQHEKLLRGLVDHHICNSSGLKKELSHLYKVPGPRITVIPNGVNTEFFRPPEIAPPPERKVAICVARLVPVKDHRTLISAFGLLAGKNPDAELWVVGDGPEEKEILRHANRVLPGARFKMFPGRAEIGSLLSRSSLLVLSSVAEGMPNAILEAMACGLPVVATSVGGVPEVVEDGRTGFLVPPRNAQALADALGRMLADENMAAAMGRNGRMRIEQSYSVAAMVRMHEEVFRTLFNGAKGKLNRAGGGCRAWPESL